MDNQINIQKENVLNAYKNGNQDQKALLENLFGKDMFQPKDIKERVKTFEDACSELGEDNILVQAYRTAEFNTSGNQKDVSDVVAYLKLRIIAAALNEGWEPTFGEDECRYYPWFYIYAKEKYEKLDKGDKKFSRVPLRSNGSASAVGGIVCASAVSAGSVSYSSNSVRLAFKTEELAEYCGKQFIDIWADFLFA